MARRLPSTNALLAAALGAALGAAAAGCPQTGVVCNPGLTPCGSDFLNQGTSCADVSTDVTNCGVCGVACAPTQVCSAGVCQCQPGATACGTRCVVIASDPNNCGGCAGDGGMTCAAGQFCEAGVCTVSCQLGSSTACGQSCADTQSDPNNCGACGHVCNGLPCRGGNCSYDVVAACTTDGEVVGLTSGPDTLGPLAPFGSAPGALATLSGVLLSADQSTATLVEGRLFDFSVLPESPALGGASSQLVAADPFLYVVNPAEAQLLVLQRNGVRLPDGGPRPPSPFDWVFDAGLGFVPIARVDAGVGAAPEGAVLLGSSLYVTLSGAQTIQQLGVSNPFAPAAGQSFGLGTVPLAPFDGGPAAASPQGITTQNGLLYAALANLDPTGQPAGPGVVAIVDPNAGPGATATSVSLGASCLAPSAIVGDGTNLFVSCSGAVARDVSLNVLSNSGDGVVMLAAPVGMPPSLTSSWTPACPAGGDGGCLVPVPGPLALVGARLYVGDTNGGRLFALDVVGTQLVERRGYAATDGGPPIQACPVSALGRSSVGSLVTP